MSLKSRIHKLEEANGGEDLTVIITRFSGNDLMGYDVVGGEAIRRNAGECEEAFTVRAEAEARKAVNSRLLVMKEIRDTGS